MKRIQPVHDLFFQLMSVQNPARYVGGEFGARPETGDPGDDLVVALCFPDLYEIGMSNTAIKILYDMLNSTPGVCCERVFLPAPEFEQVLRDSNVNLYTLESGFALRDCDVIAFSIGYELSATNVLAVLDLAAIPLRCKNRADSDPLVIAGGPGISSNPLPMGAFIDGVFIGEAEASVPQLAADLRDLKKSGAGRRQLLHRLHEQRHIWHAGTTTRVRRAIWNDFGHHATLMRVPVPSLKIVQDHGVVEIMRGCPQGCRFCSACVYYRPYRMKSPEAIAAEVEHLVSVCGYRNISLSSLSSGDYSEVEQLFSMLNRRFAHHGVSFALPSLRVNSLTLPILQLVSHVRKSGLTFAVETASESGQYALNKLVPLDRTIDVLREARDRGWRVAKFYFMIGLPVPGDDEARQIIEFFERITAAVPLQYNLAIATFVPKPHTPLQWCPQMRETQSAETIRRIKSGLKRLGVKVGYQAPFQSTLEGVLSRGDEGVAELIEAAFARGCRLDAWEEYLKRDTWRALLDANPHYLERTASGLDPSDPLPWENISSGVTKSALLREFERSRRGQLTEQCAPECVEPCGVCNRTVQVRPLDRDSLTDSPEGDTGKTDAAGTETDRPADAPTAPLLSPQAAELSYVVFSFEKHGPALFLSHLALLSVFERSLMRAGINAQFSGGFNPKPRLEFAQPLSLGIESDDEVCSLYVHGIIHPERFCEHLSVSFPAGLRVRSVLVSSYSMGTQKAPSLMSRFWGGEYRIWGDRQHLSRLVELFAADELVDRFTQHDSEAAVHLDFRLRSHARAGAGVVKHLSALLGAHPFECRLRLRRLRSLCHNGDSPEPIPFLNPY